MDLGISGKTALVTGASRGIGLAIAQTLAAEGVRVVGAARTITPELEKVASTAVSADLSTRDGATSIVDQALAGVGGIDFLVNNVGGGDPEGMTLGGVLDVDDEQWQGIFNLNLFSAVWTTRAALPSILERKGAIVNISSINARVPSGSPVGHAEAKAGLTQFGKRLSEEPAPRGVRVNTVSPGVVASPLWTDPDGFGAKVAAASGVGHGDLLAGLPGQVGIASGRLPNPRRWRTWSPSCCPTVPPTSTAPTTSSTAARSRTPGNSDRGSNLFRVRSGLTRRFRLARVPLKFGAR